MRWPFIMRSTLDKAAQGWLTDYANATAAWKEEAATTKESNQKALDVQAASHRARVTDLESKINVLTQQNQVAATTIKTYAEDLASAAKILGVLTQRQAVRVLIKDLAGLPPTITVEPDERARVPTLQVRAHYPDRYGEIIPEIPPTEEIVVGRKE